MHANLHDIYYTGGFLMLNYCKVLQLHFEGVSQRTISASTGHSRNTVSEIVQRVIISRVEVHRFAIGVRQFTTKSPLRSAFLYI